MQWKRMIIVGLALMLSACGTADDQNDDTNGNGDMNGNGGDMEEDGDMNGEATGSADNGDMTEDLSNDMVADDQNMQDDMDGTDSQMDDMNGQNDTDNGEIALDQGVREMELEIQFTDDTEWEFEYETEDDQVDAEIEKDDDSKEGDEAREEIEEMLGNVRLNDQQADDEMASEVISALDLNEDDIYMLEFYIELENDEMYNIQQTY